MPILGVNIDHVATLRQARYRDCPLSPLSEPSPQDAARICEKSGASGITAHLREDRRHMIDSDIYQLKNSLTTKLNLEMGIAPDIVAIALDVLPHDVCLVPENRQEVTTEGGLDCAASFDRLAPIVATLREHGIRVSLFIDPEPAQVEATARLGAEFIELHTGAYANEADPAAELTRLHEAAHLAVSLGLRVNAGHGLNYRNVRPICSLPGIEELNIGHSIISRAVFVGLEQAVREMVALVSAQPPA